MVAVKEQNFEIAVHVRAVAEHLAIHLVALPRLLQMSVVDAVVGTATRCLHRTHTHKIRFNEKTMGQVQSTYHVHLPLDTVGCTYTLQNKQNTQTNQIQRKDQNNITKSTRCNSHLKAFTPEASTLLLDITTNRLVKKYLRVI